MYSALVLLCVGTLLAGAPNEVPDRTGIFNENDHLGAAYDLPFGNYRVHRHKVAPQSSLAVILVERGVHPDRIQDTVRASRGVFDVRRIQAGRPILALHDIEREDALRYLVYEENKQDFVVFDLNESVKVYRGRKLKRLREREVFGVIETSLYHALTGQGLPKQLTNALADVFHKRIDFRKLQPGDRFRLIFEEEIAAGKAVGLGRIKAAWFARGETEHYAFLYDKEHETLYLDESGKGVRTDFLRAPIKGGRVSSHYAGRRFHPVQKRYKAHLGTDYAAPEGTPILAMADGEVTEARRARYNGRYVKLKHDAVYETQYLHMSRIAEGIESGVKVKRGQVIGYVGRTGLATGEHVCLRFWKNGRQVDYRRQRFADSRKTLQATPAEKAVLIDPLKKRLDAMEQPVMISAKR
ncbi:MAG: M23 family metallopeptidase [Acidobacteriota bacterium]|nr:M23 family metallopeptidase [Acidobacteriota bacterium]